MSNPKADDATIVALIKKGVSQAEIARQLGVTRAAINQRISRGKLESAILFQSSEVGRALFENQLDLAVEIETMVYRCKSILQKLDDAAEGKIPLKDLEPLLSKKTSPIEAIGKTSAELRKTLQFAYEILKDLNSIKRARDFQDTVLEVLKETDPMVAKKLRDALWNKMGHLIDQKVIIDVGE